MKLTSRQQQMHERALNLVKQHSRIEAELIQSLQEIDACKLYKKLECPSLFVYATQKLGLSEAVAYAFISVARKAKEIDSLQSAIKKQELSVSKATRIVSSLRPENAKELIEFAKTHTSKQIDFKLAEKHPERRYFDKITPISKTHVEMRALLSIDTLEKLKRAESLVAQNGSIGKLNEVLSAVLDVYLYHKDPVKKAERAGRKNSNSTPNSVKQSRFSTARRPLTAAQRHAVFKRDQGRCTHVDLSGKRCNQDRWTEKHHIVPVNLGGTNEPENITTLCSFHHDLVHQLSFEIEGGLNWLRSPSRPYNAAKNKSAAPRKTHISTRDPKSMLPTCVTTRPCYSFPDEFELTKQTLKLVRGTQTRSPLAPNQRSLQNLDLGDDVAANHQSCRHSVL